MKLAPVLFVCLLACVLFACGQQQAPSVDALSAHPARLHLLKEQCRAGQHDGVLCTQVAQADLRRFLSSKAGSGEYQTLADLPPIPPSFDEPAKDDEAVASSGQEDLP